jgi:hypothetical protein
MEINDVNDQRLNHPYLRAHSNAARFALQPVIRRNEKSFRRFPFPGACEEKKVRFDSRKKTGGE